MQVRQCVDEQIAHFLAFRIHHKFDFQLFDIRIHLFAIES